MLANTQILNYLLRIYLIRSINNVDIKTTLRSCVLHEILRFFIYQVQTAYCKVAIDIRGLTQKKRD
jgi:hypothetical protein